MASPARTAADPALFDPHMNRMLGKFDRARGA
jgi:hypothetical protein